METNIIRKTTFVSKGSKPTQFPKPIEALQPGSSKPTQFPKPIEDRTVKPVKDEEKRVMKDHDRTGKPVEGSSHKVQEVGSLEHRDDADKFYLAIDDENIDYNISGVPNAM